MKQIKCTYCSEAVEVNIDHWVKDVVDLGWMCDSSDCTLERNFGPDPEQVFCSDCKAIIDREMEAGITGGLQTYKGKAFGKEYPILVALRSV